MLMPKAEIVPTSNVLAVMLALPPGATMEEVQILLYRAVAGGFENLAEVRLSVTP